MELTEDGLVISKPLSDLDEDVVEFTDILEEHDVEYAIVIGYVAILTGRSRATEDIDVLLEPLPEERIETLVQTLRERGYWGPAMPLDDMYGMLRDGSRIRVAKADAFVPNFELVFATSAFERKVLRESVRARVGHAAIQISSIENQIAYKVRLAQDQGSTAGRDFEDALHLFLVFDGQLNREKLESSIRALGAGGYYDELRNA